MQQGVIREIHFREDAARAVILLAAASHKQAEEALSGLPLVRAGLVGFDIIGLRPYPGLERLFKG